MKKILLGSILLLSIALFFPKNSYAQSCSCYGDGFGGCMVGTECSSGSARCNLESGGMCSCSCIQPTPTPGADFTDLCSFAQGEGKSQCDKCVTSDPPGIWTAIGCIPATIDGFVKIILPFAMGIGGGIAFLLMLFGALQIMTSAGNPEKLNAGKELVTSAIVGLLLIIFSIFLLRLIGADILGIPGFRR